MVFVYRLLIGLLKLNLKNYSSGSPEVRNEMYVPNNRVYEAHLQILDS
jgi:hypothetical protein